MLLRATCLLAALVLYGCGNDAAEAPVTESASVDPRFASAEALLDYYNSISTREPVDARAALELFYPENDLQRRYLGIAQNLRSVAELDRLMFERFGECMDPKKRKHSLSPDQPATMTKREDSRAQAQCIDSKGKKTTLHLVQIGDRWWVSGYTFEYETEWKESIADLDRFEQFVRSMAAASQNVATSITDGSLKSAQEARKALGQAIIATTPPS
jgi:hypothetical protein